MSVVVRSHKRSNFDFQHDMSVDFSDFTTISTKGDAPMSHLTTWVGHSLMGREVLFLGVQMKSPILTHFYILKPSLRKQLK